MLQIIIQLMEGKFLMASRWLIPLNCEGFCTVSFALAVFLRSGNFCFPLGFFPSHCIKYFFNYKMVPIKLKINIQLVKGKSLVSSI